MADPEAGKQGVLLASLGTIAELGEPSRTCYRMYAVRSALGCGSFKDKSETLLNICSHFSLLQPPRAMRRACHTNCC